MHSANKRKYKRIRIDRSVRVPIQLFPRVPFIGPSVQATLTNLSGGGMALALDWNATEAIPQRGTKLKIHFRLPGRPLQECLAVVTHSVVNMNGQATLGIRFEKTPPHLVRDFEAMAADNAACDHRLEQSDNPWCLPTCSFFDLCRKPIRPVTHAGLSPDRMEIVLESRK